MSVTNQQKETLKTSSEMSSNNNDANNKTATTPETRTEVAHWLNQKDPTTFSKFLLYRVYIFEGDVCMCVCVFDGVICRLCTKRESVVVPTAPPQQRLALLYLLKV
jgi:hypothetical protein